MEKVQEKDLDFAVEGIEFSSAKITLSDRLLEEIPKAKELLSKEENSFISSVNLYAGDVDIVQFDGALDDDQRKEIPYDDVFHFRWDTGVILVLKHGGCYFRAYGKYDSSYYFEMGLD
jgi:hypothetical protein